MSHRRDDGDDHHGKGAQRRDDIVKGPVTKAGHQVEQDHHDAHGDHLVQNVFAEGAALADGLRHRCPACAYAGKDKQRPPALRPDQQVEGQADDTDGDG